MTIAVERSIEEVIMTSARRAAAHAMADLARFYVSVGGSLYYEKTAPEVDAGNLAKLYTRIDATYRQCDRLGFDFEANIVEDTLDVLLEGTDLDDEARRFAEGFVKVALTHFEMMHDEIAKEEQLVTQIAEARIAARLALGDALEDNGDLDYAEARVYVDDMALRNGKKRLAELNERNRIFINAVAQAA
jgi:hypothetical protein